MPRPASKMHLEVVLAFSSLAVHEGSGGKDLAVCIEAVIDAVNLLVAGFGTIFPPFVAFPPFAFFPPTQVAFLRELGR